MDPEGAVVELPTAAAAAGLTAAPAWTLPPWRCRRSAPALRRCRRLGRFGAAAAAALVPPAWTLLRLCLRKRCWWVPPPPPRDPSLGRGAPVPRADASGAHRPAGRQLLAAGGAVGVAAWARCGDGCIHQVWHRVTSRRWQVWIARLAGLLLGLRPGRCRHGQRGHLGRLCLRHRLLRWWVLRPGGVLTGWFWIRARPLALRLRLVRRRKVALTLSTLRRVNHTLGLKPIGLGLGGALCTAA